MEYDEATTRVLTTAILMHQGAILKPRAGHRLRVIEEPIPPECLPIDKTLGAPRKPGA